MANSLVELPIELIEMIFAPLDDNSLLELRKVCKATKSIAEATILNRTDSPVIDCLRLFGEVECRVCIKYKLDNENSLQSKLFVVSAIGYLQITGFSYRKKEMLATMSPAETTSFFERFTPFMHNAKCNIFEFCPSTPEMFSRTSNFLKGKTIPELAFKLLDSDQSKDFILQLVGQLQTSIIRLFLDVPVVHMGAFLTHLAEIVDTLNITTPRNAYKEFDKDVLFCDVRKLVCEILKKRCSFLGMTNGFIAMPLKEAILLARALEGITWKKIYFTAPTDVPNPRTNTESTQKVAVVEDKHMPTGTRIEIGNMRRP